MVLALGRVTLSLSMDDGRAALLENGTEFSNCRLRAGKIRRSALSHIVNLGETVRLPCLVLKSIALCSSDCPKNVYVCIGRTRRRDSWPRLLVEWVATFEPSQGRTWVRSKATVIHGYEGICWSRYISCNLGITLSNLTCLKESSTLAIRSNW